MFEAYFTKAYFGKKTVLTVLKKINIFRLQHELDLLGGGKRYSR